MDQDIGVSGDDLPLGTHGVVLLELEIAQRTRQGQVAIHAAILNVPAGTRNSRLFSCGIPLGK